MLSAMPGPESMMSSIEARPLQAASNDAAAVAANEAFSQSLT